MSIKHLLTRPCTIVSRRDSGEVDDYNSPVLTETRTDTVCDIQQAKSDEPPAQGELSVTAWKGFFLPDAVLGTGDAIEVDDETYEVAGDPWKVWDPWRKRHSHIEASLKRVATAGEETA
jgi:hypothetical protein